MHFSLDDFVARKLACTDFGIEYDVQFLKRSPERFG